MKTDDVKRILVVGAGQMGAQIAMQSALHGYQITLNDLNMELLQKGMAGNRKQLERRVQKGQMTKEKMEEAIARVKLEPDLEKAARDADFVIEAIVERLEPKKECFARLDRFCPPHAILATNSSTLMNSQIAPSTKRPEKCVNMHYFYPPLVLKLVEVVKGQWTSEETVEITAEVARGNR
jgi:3-hydroxybutyryl-CoA dehydrogenase